MLKVRVVALLSAVLVMGGCRASAVGPSADVCITGLEPVTIEGIGAGQGVSYIDGMVYAYGDAETGVIVELRPAADGLEPTGRRLVLTVGGVDVAPHPTGLTRREGVGCFMGNTVDGEGTIFVLDWERAWERGTLDGCVLNRVEDDAAVNGSRPELVRWRGRWVVATSDYGDEGNEVRLYEARALRRAVRTSDPGVLVKRFACGPWVQNLHWMESEGLLVLVQNQVEGLRYRLTFGEFDRDGDLRFLDRVDLGHARDELEGFTTWGAGRCALVSSSREENGWVGRVRVRK